MSREIRGSRGKLTVAHTHDAVVIATPSRVVELDREAWAELLSALVVEARAAFGTPRP
jgi:hypothetical protein